MGIQTGVHLGHVSLKWQGDQLMIVEPSTASSVLSLGIALVHCEPSTVRLQNEMENSLVFRNFDNNVSN